MHTSAMCGYWVKGGVAAGFTMATGIVFCLLVFRLLLAGSVKPSEPHQDVPLVSNVVWVVDRC